MPAKAKSSKGKNTPKTKKASTKKTSTKKRTKVETKPEVVKQDPVVEAPVVEAPVEEPTTVQEKTTTNTQDVVSSQLTALRETVSLLMSQLKNVQGDIKTLEKNYSKVLKEHAKTASKGKRQNRKPSGFAKPSALTPEMTSFLGLDKDVEMPRNEVTKLINKYIVENDLRNADDKRKILPDKKLGKLLGWDGKQDVSYFNLQSFIKHHFVKAEVSA